MDAAQVGPLNFRPYFSHPARPSSISRSSKYSSFLVRIVERYWTRRNCTLSSVGRRIFCRLSACRRLEKVCAVLNDLLYQEFSTESVKCEVY